MPLVLNTTRRKRLKNPQSTYQQLGVSTSKKEVHKAVAQLGEGEIPYCFCKFGLDLAGDPNYVTCSHGDGSGSKSIFAYLLWKKTGDIRVWRGVGIDAMAMNINDMVASGVTGPYIAVMFINRNKFFIPGEVINEIIAGAKAFCEHMKKFGILIDYRTGETADLADQVRTVTVDMSVTARIKKTDVITTERIAPGNIIVGLASHGQTEWEEEENYGPASNGFTGFRHGFLHSEYKTKFPETYAPEVTDKKYKKLIFRGKYSVEDMLIGAESLGKVLTSPTRVCAPLFKSFLDDLSPKNRKKITGIIHNSGGGQTKVLGYVQPGIKVVKNSLHNLGLIPPVFRAYQKAGKISERELHETTNVGVLKEVYFSDNGLAREFIQQSRELGIHTDVIGRVEENKNMAKKVLLIKREDNKWLSFTR